MPDPRTDQPGPRVPPVSRWLAKALIAVALLGVVGWLAFGFLAIHKAFVDESVHDPRPTLGDGRPQLPLVASGRFENLAHPGSGRASVLGNPDGDRYLRLETFRTENGPDLQIYLSAAPIDAGATALEADVVDLGRLKGNIGDQNYEIPRGTDVVRYKTVVVWCSRFAVPFTGATLFPT